MHFIQFNLISTFYFQGDKSSLFERMPELHQTRGRVHLKWDGKSITTETTMKCKNFSIFILFLKVTPGQL